jgi:hypothetical protein
MSSALQVFLDTTLGSHAAVWQSSGIRAMSHLNVPERVYGGREELLRGDIHFVWARWFLESICDPARFVGNPKTGYAHIFREVYGNLTGLLADTPKDEVQKFASALALFVSEEVSRQEAKAREAIDLDERRRVLGESPRPARCWVCGYQFTDAAVKRFLKEDDIPPIRPLSFVDCMTLRGRQVRDLLIEVDHVLPVAAGGHGGENLRLACGWCNRHKNDNLSLYDQAFSPLRIRHPTLGLMTIPRPFWVVRVLSYRERCEWPGGCDRTSANAQLLIAARRQGGAMNPANVIVVCEKHDPLTASRLVNPNRIEVLE